MSPETCGVSKERCSESLKNSSVSPELNYTTAIFEGRGINTPHTPLIYSLSDLARLRSPTEHSRAPLYSPP
jgi:hypothetical protein